MGFDLKNKKILIVDDFSTFRGSIKKMLLLSGARNIDEADSGENAIFKMENNSYDIVLCDYNLGHGKKDGQQILEEAKHNKLIRFSTVFIMLTAENTVQMVMGAVEYQPDDYLIKPISRGVLIQRLEKIVQKKSDFEDIEKAIRNKEYMSAVSLCDEHVKNNPKNMLEYMRLKSDLSIMIGHYDDAIDVFEKVLLLRDIPWARLGIGKILFLKGEYLKAKDVFHLIIEENKSFMEAYDWLAKTLEELGSLDEAQQVLVTATGLSPKAILRHQKIGKISYRIDDYEKAEEAFKEAINIGKNSCFKSPSDYTGLAKTYMEKDSSEDALSILDSARNEFNGDQGAMLQTYTTEGIVFKKMNREEDAKKAVEEATKIEAGFSGNVPVESKMELAQICFETGAKEKGIEFMKDIVRNNHDNEKLLEKVQDVFKIVELEDEGEKVIESTKNEMVQLNNQGVSLVEEGKLEEATAYFDKAAKGHSENKIINANAAHALIKYMRKNGTDDQKLYKTIQYLDKVKEIDPSYEQYQKLLTMYDALKDSEANSNK